MPRDLLRFRFFRRHAEVGTLLLRLFVGFVLVYGTQDNVFSTERMLEFRDFLAQNSFPGPLAMAYLSVYAQFVCGLLILAGLFTRIAALLMVGNFIVALAMVHVVFRSTRTSHRWRCSSAPCFCSSTGPDRLPSTPSGREAR